MGSILTDKDLSNTDIILELLLVIDIVIRWNQWLSEVFQIYSDTPQVALNSLQGQRHDINIPIFVSLAFLKRSRKYWLWEVEETWALNISRGVKY